MKKLQLFGRFANAVRSKSTEAYVEKCSDGSLKSPTVHKYVNGASATHGSDPRVAQHLRAAKDGTNWSVTLIKEDVEIQDNLGGQELQARRVTEIRPMGKAANEAALAKMFQSFTDAAQKIGYSRETKMALDVIELEPLSTSPAIQQAATNIIAVDFASNAPKP